MPSAPQGKAIFVRQWETIGGGGGSALPADEWVARYTGAGFRWAAPLVMSHSGGDARELNRSPSYWRALRDRRVDAWGTWLLPAPGAEDDAHDVAGAIADLGGVGLLNDPELAFKNQEDAARRFDDACHEACDRAGIGYAVTSYSRPRFHASFPWRVFSRHAEWGLAQTYDRELAFDRRYVPQAIAEWRAKGFAPVLVGAGTWVHDEDRAKTPAELERHLSLIPPRVRGVCVWPPQHISEAMWDVLADWRGPTGAGGTSIIGPALLAMAGLGLALMR